ncbi:unnamed protein product [Caenorhabditis sp. 36 PRJEB53466]|nr:unnamed protein product [Caenorhabditis sp. 36 PRJEB53466]
MSSTNSTRNLGGDELQLVLTNIISILSTSVNIVGVYVIIASPSQDTWNFKYSQLLYHLVLYLCQVYVGTVLNAVFLLPLPGIYCIGWLKEVSDEYVAPCLFIFYFLLSFQAELLTILLTVKLCSVARPDSRFKLPALLQNALVLAFLLLNAVPHSLLFLISNSSHSDNIAFVLKSYPEHAYLLRYPFLWMVKSNKLYLCFAICVAVSSGLIILTIAIAYILVVYELELQLMSMSKKVAAAHKQFVDELILHSKIVLAFFLPFIATFLIKAFVKSDVDVSVLKIPEMRGLQLFLLIFPLLTFAEEWDAYNFPNPTAGQFQQCKMRTTANICDPDEVLSEQSRYRLDHDLKQLESRTRQDYGKTFCDKKGVTAAMAVARHVKGGTTEAVEAMANDMLRKWTLDPQCKKAVVIVVSTDDMKFWVARDDKVPVYADEFTQIFMQQKAHFQQKNYQQALTNIMQATWEKALSKQGSPRQPSRGGNQGPGAGGGGQPNFGGGGGGKSGGGGFKMPSIPGWFWLFLVGIVIPLLCCCCCIYCCCCRGKGGGGAANNPQRLPTDPQGGGGYPQPAPQGGGGGRSMFSNILSSGGGAAAGSMISRFLSNRGRGGGGGGGMEMGGGNRGYGFQGGNQGQDAGPVYDDNQGQGGGGLYPSREVKDRGGGGSWA